MVWIMVVVLCACDINIREALARPVDYAGVHDNKEDHAEPRGVVTRATLTPDLSSQNKLTTISSTSNSETLTNSKQSNKPTDKGHVAPEIVEFRGTGAIITTPVTVQFVQYFKRWDVQPRLYPAGITTSKVDTKLMILPLGFFLLFLIGLGIKATHWWNEDIRYADGLMVNIYTPHKTPRRVLAKIYSTEQSAEYCVKSRESVRRKDGIKPEEPLVVLPGNASKSSIYMDGDNCDDDDIFGASDNKRNTYRATTGRSKRQRKTRHSSAGSGSPTESLCSRCRHMDVIDSRLQMSERDLERYNTDNYIMDLCKMGASSVAMRRLQRQASSLSTHSTATTRSDTCSESASHSYARSTKSSDRINIHGGASREKLNVRRKLNSSDNGACLEVNRGHRLRKNSPMTSRASSESHISVHRTRKPKKPAATVEPEALPSAAVLNTLLKNSLNLNLDILRGIALAGTRLNPVRLSGEAGDKANDSNPVSPNQASRGSSSYLSSSDITSSNSTSARTSVTGLFSSQSSAGSLHAAISRQNSKGLPHFLHGKHYLQYENNSKAISAPSLKMSNRVHLPPPKSDKDVVFTIGNHEIPKNKHRTSTHRSWSGSGELDWEKSAGGQTNLALCRSVSMDSVFGSGQQVSIDDASRETASSHSSKCTLQTVINK